MLVCHPTTVLHVPLALGHIRMPSAATDNPIPCAFGSGPYPYAISNHHTPSAFGSGPCPYAIGRQTGAPRGRCVFLSAAFRRRTLSVYGGPRRFSREPQGCGQRCFLTSLGACLLDCPGSLFVDHASGLYEMGCAKKKLTIVSYYELPLTTTNDY